MNAMLLADSSVDSEAGLRPLVRWVKEAPPLAAFLDRALSAAGFRVERSGDGAHGLLAFDALTPDLVVVDLVLPRVGGLEVARQVRARSSAPILMLASDRGVDDRV